ncbi:hypothetical protein C8R43DRAFT_865820, partial [Mycena crocata]
FPPHPPSKADQHRIISGMCNDFDPANFEESGCSVCGELVPKIELTRKEDLPDLNYELLCENEVTRKERFSENDPVEELHGPIMADDCDHICVECESFLRKGKRPLKSLANYLWVGKIPWQLADLSWAEKMLIARVRHNRCVVRVASGRGKLSANAIMFQTPIIQVYDTLPPSKEEMSEVLAFVFLGPNRPTEDEYARTPMLVRKSRVREALDWLKLNHSDYTQLNISQRNLDDLPEHGMPFGVDWKQTVEGETNRTAEEMSLNDEGEEEGTNQGPCTFAVHGLSGEEYSRAG